jgi:cell division protein FtsB
MVVRSRLRAFLIPLVLYLVSGGVVGYFVYHAQHGDRGIATKMALKQQIVDLTKELDELKGEHTRWDERVAMLRNESVDKDLLDEEARLTLNRLHRNDVVIMTGSGAPPR